MKRLQSALSANEIEIDNPSEEGADMEGSSDEASIQVEGFWMNMGIRGFVDKKKTDRFVKRIVEGDENSSVGSSMVSSLQTKNTLRSIRLNISNQSAPIRLVLAIALLVLGLSVCIITNLASQVVLDKHLSSFNLYYGEASRISEYTSHLSGLHSNLLLSCLQLNFSDTGRYISVKQPPESPALGHR